MAVGGLWRLYRMLLIDSGTKAHPSSRAMEQWEAFSSIWKSLAPDSMAHILGHRNQPPDVFTHIKGGKNEGIIGAEEHSSTLGRGTL